MRFPVRFVEMYEDLFIAGTTLPKRLGAGDLKKDVKINVKMEYDTELRMLIVHHPVMSTLVPYTACKSIVPFDMACISPLPNGTTFPNAEQQAAADRHNANIHMNTASGQSHPMGIQPILSAQVEDPTKPARGRKTA